MISAAKLEEAFPDVTPGVKPLGARVLVQLRTVRAKTVSGIVLVDDTRTFNKANTQLGKVIALGPIAFCNRETGKTWNEGVWAEPGQFVRIPKYGGDRFERAINCVRTIVSADSQQGQQHFICFSVHSNSCLFKLQAYFNAALSLCVAKMVD